jgi:hypothetical protein
MRHRILSEVDRSPEQILSVSLYRARSPSLSREYKCMRPPQATKSLTTSLVWRNLGAGSSPVYFHEAQTLDSLSINKFVTSTPGVARNLYSSCGSEISLVWFRLFFCKLTPERIQTQFCQASCSCCRSCHPYVTARLLSHRNSQCTVSRRRGFEPR